MKLPLISTLAIGSSLLLCACASTSDQYYWGQYEALIYKQYHQPGEATPEVQIQQLLVDIQQAESQGKRIAPGVYAHLGSMYAAQGKLELAIAALTEEKTLYPDSTRFIDGMISRALKNKQAP